jgi:hypothetical protein
LLGSLSVNKNKPDMALQLLKIIDSKRLPHKKQLEKVVNSVSLNKKFYAGDKKLLADV